MAPKRMEHPRIYSEKLVSAPTETGRAAYIDLHDLVGRSPP